MSHILLSLRHTVKNYAARKRQLRGANKCARFVSFHHFRMHTHIRGVGYGQMSAGRQAGGHTNGKLVEKRNLYFHLKWVTTITFYCTYISFLITIHNVCSSSFPSLRDPLALLDVPNAKYFQVFIITILSKRRHVGRSVRCDFLWFYAECWLPPPSARHEIGLFTMLMHFVWIWKLFYAHFPASPIVAPFISIF